MSLSTHVKRISPSQWRYYYNQLLFIDAPLSANFMQGLVLPKGNSPTVEITPITASDDIAEEAYDAYSEPLILEALVFEDLLTQLPWQTLNQRFVVNIYSNVVLNKDPKSHPVAVSAWGTQPHLTTPFTEGLGEPLSPARSKVEIPETLCQVSALLAGFMTH